MKSTLDFVGAVESHFWLMDGKCLSRNYHQGYRVYSSLGLSNTISSNSIGGLGGHSGLYLVINNDKERN